MRALTCRGDGTPAVDVVEVVEPQPAPNEITIEVRAASINRGELRLLAARPSSWRPGQDVAGVVATAAADGSGPPVGSRVVAWVDQAGWAERTTAATDRVAMLSDDVPLAAAATLPVAGITALRALRRGPDLLGRRALVTGATGGVGRFAVELAVRAGATVTGIARSASKTVGLEDLGAELFPDVADAKGPFDLILESVGGRSLERSWEIVAHSGTVVVFGNSSNEHSAFTFRDFSQRPAKVEVFFVYQSGLPFGPDLQLLADLVGSDRLHPRIGLEVPWMKANSALGALGAGHVAGKAVLSFG